MVIVLLKTNIGLKDLQEAPIANRRQRGVKQICLIIYYLCFEIAAL